VPSPPPPIPTEGELFARLSLDELNAKHPLDDAFFAFDRADLSDEARATLQWDAHWMKQWTTVRVLISGHADERGTNEYNMALGERRAASARNYLIDLGVAMARINIVSKGEEQPFCTEHEEACWSQNRRAHFLVTAK
jgi:peptidoglycan-associated lipoprotein